MLDVTAPANDQERWAHPNRLGSTALVSDASGAAVETHAYAPYGAPGAAGPGGFPYRFTGQRLDPESGLYFYKARYYDPELGRFLQTDPVGYADQMNLYAYVGNDPVNATDPTGMDACYVLVEGQASGAGHAAACSVDGAGNFVIADFSGNGEVRTVASGSLSQGGLDRDGNLTEAGLVEIGAAAADFYATPEGGGYEGAFTIVGFHGADDHSGFLSAVEKLSNIVMDNGGASRGPLGGAYSRDDVEYGLLNCNCGDVAGLMLSAAGQPPVGRPGFPTVPKDQFVNYLNHYATEPSRVTAISSHPLARLPFTGVKHRNIPRSRR